MSQRRVEPDESREAIEFRKALSRIIQGSTLPAKRRESSIKPDVETLNSLSYDRGVLPAELNDLIDLVTIPNHLDQANLASIVRNLYPASTVSDNVVTKVVGSIGHGRSKPSLAIQGSLLRWLVMVYHIIQSQDALARGYSVLFNLLDTAAIRLSLARQTGNDPALTGLLRVFKDYYPEIIVGEATRCKASAFNYPNPEWRERLDAIQQAHAERAISRSQRPLNSFRVARHRNGGRGNNGAMVPEVHTSHVAENSVSLEEIENVDGFVKALETIELPNQLIAVLGDPLLQKLLLLKPDAEANQRVNNWVSSYAHDMISGDSDANPLDILATLRDYVSSTKSFPPMFFALFSEYLKTWDGRHGRELVLGVLSYIPMLEFGELYNKFLQPLEARVLDDTAASLADILQFYTALLQRWTVTLASVDQLSVRASSATAGLITHVNGLCLTLLQTSSSIFTHSMVLDFYEQGASLMSGPRNSFRTRVVIPPSPLAYMLFFTPSPTTVSRLCGLLAKYKQGLQKAMSTSRSDYTPEYVNEFNGFLMDICNCLWRSRAFNTKDDNSHGCLVPKRIAEVLSLYIKGLDTGASLASLFSLSHSPVLGLLSISYFRSLEDAELEKGTDELATRHAGPVTRATLASLAEDGGLRLTWDEYRLGVLTYLDRNGMGGVGQLMYNTMTTLMKKV
ncbi:hypothetical protein DL765_003852 [Monosporascus sp. GIB2]|nr:hypothetical protein DL765_003852 [Monosporascus sp. GIB2]